MTSDLVSILMTAYNRQQFIAEAIESVLCSTYQNWELIIVDDGSKDDTVVIANYYAAKDERIKVYINEKNLGDYPNRNKAASYAKGEYIVIVDSDDWMLPKGLKNWMTYILNAHTDFGIFVPGFTQETISMEPEKSIAYHFFTSPIFMSGPGATIVKYSFFKNIKGFPEKYGPANDMYYNLKAASNTRITILPQPMGDYRRHEHQEINNQFSYLYNNYLYLRDALLELNLPLTPKQITYLNQKNKRRFVVNTLRFFFKTLNTKKTIFAIRKSEFKFKDWLSAIFH